MSTTAYPEINHWLFRIEQIEKAIGRRMHNPHTPEHLKDRARELFKEEEQIVATIQKGYDSPDGHLHLLKLDYAKLEEILAALDGELTKTKTEPQ